MPVDPTLTEPFIVGGDEVGGVAGIGGEYVATAPPKVTKPQVAQASGMYTVEAV